MKNIQSIKIHVTQKEVSKPKRSTTGSAGHDVFAQEEILLPKGKVTEVFLPFVFEGKDEGVKIDVFVRSSFGIKKKIRLYENGSKQPYPPFITLHAEDDHHVIHLINEGEDDLTIQKGEHFVQFLIRDNTPNLIRAEIEDVRKDEMNLHEIAHAEVVDSHGMLTYILNDDLVLNAKEQVVLATGKKAKIPDGTWLGIVVKGELRHRITLANGCAVVDKDYYGNEGNDGHVFVGIVNISDEKTIIPKGTPLLDWWCEPYHVLQDEEEATGIRRGGIGHT